MIKKRGKAWVISVNMGYGHDRAAYPLKDIAHTRIITANNDKIISQKEQTKWYQWRMFYESVSRLKHVPLLGKLTFGIYDKFQEISPFFPFRDLSKSNWVVMYFRDMIKRGFGKSLIEYIQQEKLPIVTTHWLPAMMAYYNGIEDIYCLITDTDLNRVWVPHDPKDCYIKYLAPCEHVAFRLKEYGISEKNIILTGFPLPKENIGNRLDIIKHDLAARLKNLDPKKRFISRYPQHVRSKLGKYFGVKPRRRLTLTYMVGGAGAEKGIGITIVSSLRNKIKQKKIVVNLVAGSRLDVFSYFKENLKKEGLDDLIGKGVNIIYALGRNYYFKTINEVLRTTDIVWTKPSEISFYCGLGLPIIIAPPVGAHERYNKEWLEHVGSGFVQSNPEYTKDWLFYWLEQGRFAEAAWEGFLEAPTMGTYEIEKLIK